MKDDPKYQYMSQIMKAMAHPTRLFILDLLAEKEYCVCELQKQIGTDISTVSKHLAVLKNAGFLKGRKDGLWIHYKLKNPYIVDLIQEIVEIV